MIASVTSARNLGWFDSLALQAPTYHSKGVERQLFGDCFSRQKSDRVIKIGCNIRVGGPEGYDVFSCIPRYLGFPTEINANWNQTTLMLIVPDSITFS